MKWNKTQTSSLKLKFKFMQEKYERNKWAEGILLSELFLCVFLFLRGSFYKKMENLEQYQFYKLLFTRHIRYAVLFRFQST